MVGYLAHGKAVEIPQGQRRPLRPWQPCQRRVCGARVEKLLPGIVRLVGSNCRKPTPFPLASAPVVDKLMPSDADQPSDSHRRRVGPPERRDRGYEGLSRQVLGVVNAAAARQQIAVYLG
jgi:hypothetical protein